MSQPLLQQRTPGNRGRGRGAPPLPARLPARRVRGTGLHGKAKPAAAPAQPSAEEASSSSQPASQSTSPRSSSTANIDGLDALVPAAGSIVTNLARKRTGSLAANVDSSTAAPHSGSPSPEQSPRAKRKLSMEDKDAGDAVHQALSAKRARSLSSSSAAPAPHSATLPAEVPQAPPQADESESAHAHAPAPTPAPASTALAPAPDQPACAPRVPDPELPPALATLSLAEAVADRAGATAPASLADLVNACLQPPGASTSAEPPAEDGFFSAGASDTLLSDVACIPDDRTLLLDLNRSLRQQLNMASQANAALEADVALFRKQVAALTAELHGVVQVMRQYQQHLRGIAAAMSH